MIPEVALKRFEWICDILFTFDFDKQNIFIKVYLHSIVFRKWGHNDKQAENEVSDLDSKSTTILSPFLS